MANYTPDSFSIDDVYYTPKYVWKAIIDYIPKDKIVWEAFYGNGQSARYLVELGCKVISEPIDFYDYNMGDIIVTNPPFSDLRQIFARLKELDKPFILIVPISNIATDYFQRMFANKCQVIIPRKRLQFEKLNSETQQIELVKGVNFASIYVCYKMNLPSDLIFLP